jgi:hypothetical protein
MLAFSSLRLALDEEELPPFKWNSTILHKNSYVMITID